MKHRFQSGGTMKSIKIIFFSLLFMAVSCGAKKKADDVTGNTDPTAALNGPALPPSALTFADTDRTTGEIAGAVVITPSSDESDVTSYTLYWGKSASAKLVATAIAEINATGSAVSHTFAPNTSLSSSATHLLAFAKNDTGENSTPAAVALTDLILPAGVVDNGDGTYTLSVYFTSDTYIAQYAPGQQTTKYGSALNLISGSDNLAIEKVRLALLGIDLSYLPTGITVQDASVFMYSNTSSPDPSTSESLQLQPLDTSFDEANVSWSSGVTMQSTNLATASITEGFIGYTEFQGTAAFKSYLEAQINSNGYIGLALRQISKNSLSTSNFTFNSTEAATDQPYLEVIFSF